MLSRCIFFPILISVVWSHFDGRPHVSTPLGEISGDHSTSYDGRLYSAFHGIPYAKPPIGQRRFEVPEPIESWDGVWEANFTSTCVQPSSQYLNRVQVDEDCLYLNVYVPRERPNPVENLPVIVHIHGGAFMYGSGHLYAHPNFIMDRDVIFVTLNYRLGVLGFLSTEDEVVPGNNGLKDQVLALVWVQENIASFGGDPNLVTLTGVSAGASCVHLHYLSDMSRGLFNRGLSESGVALNPFVIQRDARRKAQKLADAVGCPIDPSQALVNCLKQRPFQHLLDKLDLFYVLPEIPPTPFSPVVEEGANPFLKDEPIFLLNSSEVNDVPWIATNTPQEGLSPVMLNTDMATINYWEYLAPILLYFDKLLPIQDWTGATKKIKTHYLKDKRVDFKNFYDFVQIFSDRHFLVGAETAVKWQSKATTSPVFYARFEYLGDNNENKTVAHADDIKYYYGIDEQPLTPNELKMKDFLLDMLVSFAETGRPTIAGTVWEPTGFEKLTYLQIHGFEKNDLEVHTVKDLTPREFWRSLHFNENENLILGEEDTSEDSD